jgi:hypothetical protein
MNHVRRERRVNQDQMKIGRRPARTIAAIVVDFFIVAQGPANLPFDVRAVSHSPAQWSASNNAEIPIVIHC